MSKSTERVINAIMKYWEKLSAEDDSYTKWAENPIPLEGKDACLFFLKVILNQRQKSEVAREAAEEFVARFYESDEKSFWKKINSMSESALQAACSFQSTIFSEKAEKQIEKEEKQILVKEGTSYAGINKNRFPSWIKANADMILQDYQGQVENIRKDITTPSQQQVDLLRKRFKKFHGIGEELSRMAVFQLVRKYGVAGGRAARRFLKPKRDTHLLKVMRNAFFAGDPQMDDKALKKFVDGLNLDSPADFDHAAFKIGKDFCTEQDKCTVCPIHDACALGKRKVRP